MPEALGDLAKMDGQELRVWDQEEWGVGKVVLMADQPREASSVSPHYHILGQNWNPTPVSPKKINPKENKLENTETS